MDPSMKSQASCASAMLPAVSPSVQQQHSPKDSMREHKLPRPQGQTDSTTASLVCLAWAFITGRMANLEDVTFRATMLKGTTTSAQSARLNEIDTIATPNIATIPVHLKLERHRKVSEYVEMIQQQVMETVPLEQAGLHPDEMCPDYRQPYLFQSLLIIQPNTSTQNLFKRWREHSHQGWVNACPLLLDLRLGPGNITAVARFNSRAIEGWTIQKLLERLEVVMPQLGSLEADLAAIGMMSQNDLEEIRAWNSISPEPIARCVHEIFEEKVEARPNALAIHAWDGELTFGELNKLATKLASQLINFGVEPDMLVPLCFEKSMWTTVAMLGVLKAGGGFVLLDASQPELRLQAIVGQVKANLILSSVSNQALSSRLAREVVTISTEFFTGLDVEANWRAPPVCPSSVMYLNFTSGSTGTPKGAMITHSNLASALYHQAKPFGVTAQSRIYDFSSYSFDASIHHTFAAFAAGGCLCVPRDQDRRNNLAESITSLRANAIFLTPSVAQLIDPEDTPTLDSILLGGEAVHIRDVNLWWDKVRVVQGYGPCECTPFSVINGHPSNPEEAIRIGKGAGQMTWIVDPEDHNCLLPPGCTGELILAGPLVGKGYLDDPRKTEQAFIVGPEWFQQISAAGQPGQLETRFYKTGDLVQYNEDGSLTFVGRKDTQVKIHGRRVELGEIEYRTQQCMPKAKQVAAEVVMPARANSSPVLAAFIHMYDCSTQTEQPEPDGTAKILHVTADLEERLAEHLPQYMVPTAFFSMQELPMTATGKLDRRRLREIGGLFTIQQLAGIRAQGANPQPTSQVQQELQTIWGRVLAIDNAIIGLEDNFFKLGGDSIAAMKVVAEAHKVGIQLTVANIFQHPTLGSLTCQGQDLVFNTPEEIPPFALLGESFNKTSLLQDISAQYQLDPPTIEDAYPCTPLQEGLLSLSLKHPGDYVTQRTLELPSTIVIRDFCRAWEKVSRATTILRTRIMQSADFGLLQFVSHEEIQWIRATGLDQYLKVDRKRPIELGQPLARYALVKDNTGIYRWFVWTLHHALYDGWSLPLILDMVNRVYHGDRVESTRSEFKVFIKYIGEQGDMKMEEYWRNALSGCDSAPFPTLPSYIQQPAADSAIQYQLPRLPTQSQVITSSTIIRAAWALVVGRMTNSNNAVFGITTSGRSAPVVGIDEIVGPTIATVPLYVKLPGAQKVLHYLEDIQQQATDMIPFEQLGLHQIAKICPEGRQACMFQTLLIIQPQGDNLPDNTLGEWKDSGQQEWINTFALVLEIQLGVGMVNASFDSRVIKPWLVQTLLERLELVMKQLNVAGSEQSIAEIETVTPQDLKQVWEWNQTVPLLVETCVHDMIKEQVWTQPGATAICAWDGELTYKELDRLSTGVAAQLVELGVGPDILVPLCFEKSKWAIVAVLGVLKASGGFVLLDPSLPEPRLQAIFRQVGSKLLLSSAANRKLSLRLSKAVIQVGPDQPQITKYDTSAITPQPSSSIMYAVFTSGSTGVPKGVLVSHENFCSAVYHQLELLGFDKDSRVLDFASYAFDAAVHNAMATLVAGGCLCIPAERDRKDNLSTVMAVMQPTMANLTPTVARLLDPMTVRDLKTLILLGEEVTANDTDRWWSHKIHLINTYGPAECTPISTINSGASCANEVLRIGKGVGVVTWVVDPEDHNCLIPPGCIGELLLEGPLVGRGYLGDLEKTLAAFIEDPEWLLEGPPGKTGRHGRLYKTGDLVQYNEDGSLTYVGRKDSQVKIRGQRVELGEVEHHIRESFMNEATQVVAEVIVPEGENASPLLAAFVQMNNNNTETDNADPLTAKIYPIAADVKSKLEQHLPRYMVPRVFFSMPKLPMTATGKTNRRRLREIGQSMLMIGADRELGPSEGTIYAATGEGAILETEQPAYELAQKIFSMCPSWAQGSLACKKDGTQHGYIGYNDVLLQSSGLDSVNMMALLYFISQQFHVNVGMQVLMDKATSIRSLAQCISDSQATTATQQPVWHPSTHTSISVDLMAEINRHDSKITAAQYEPENLHGADDEFLKYGNNKSLTVLLTGANGFIGTQILRQLLEHRRVGRVIGLVRGETEDAARRRTIDGAMKALWWTDSHAEKLEIWPGDLSLPRLGLDSMRWNSLAEGKTVDIIIHNGAAVHWAKSYEALEATNVRSTMELLHLALAHSHVGFVYVTGGRKWDSREEREADVAKELSAPGAIGYSQTKFVAEAVVKRAAHRSAPRTNLTVVSPGLVIGTPTEGVANADDYIWRLAATCIRIGAYNADEADAWFSLSDATTVATTIIDAALVQEETVEVHIMDGMRWREFWAILGELGYRLEAKSLKEWRTAVHADIQVPRETHPLWPLAHMLDSQVGTEEERLEHSWREKRSDTPPGLKLAVKRSAEFLSRVGFLPISTDKGQGETPRTDYEPFLRSRLPRKVING